MFLVRKKMSKATRATSLDATLSYLLLILNWFLPTGQNAFVDVFNTTLNMFLLFNNIYWLKFSDFWYSIKDKLLSPPDKYYDCSFLNVTDAFWPSTIKENQHFWSSSNFPQIFNNLMPMHGHRESHHTYTSIPV